jgi:flagellar hook-associated protein 1 FlgK
MSLVTLEIAGTALSASQSAMDVASQNVANANTPGYLAQRAVLAPIADPDAGSDVLVGGGVEVATVQVLRDQCLEAQINHQQGQLGQEQSQSASLTRIQNDFPDLTQDGLSTALGNIFDALQQLQTTPADTAARQQVISDAGDFCQQMNTTASQLQSEGDTLNSDLQQQVTQANTLLTQIGALNTQITSLGSSPTANDLKVTRAQAINQLAGICGASGLDQSDGSQDVLLGGIQLVQGSEVHQLSLVPDPSDPTQQVVAVGSVTSPQGLGGAIAGDLTARDGDLKQWEGDLDDLASNFADAFNTQQEAGFDLNNAAGQAFFTYTSGSAASTLQVSQAIQADPSLLAAAGQSGGAPGDGTNAAALANLSSAKIMSGGTQTAGDFEAGMLTSIGAATQNATNAVTARQSMISALQTQYSNESGVSLDEEAVDVMRYQQMYSSAAKLVQVADQMTYDLMQAVS